MTAGEKKMKNKGIGPRSLDPTYIVTHYMIKVKTSLMYSNKNIATIFFSFLRLGSRVNVMQKTMSMGNGGD